MILQEHIENYSNIEKKHMDKQQLLDEECILIAQPKNLKFKDKALFSVNDGWIFTAQKVYLKTFANASVDGHGLSIYKDVTQKKKLIFNPRNKKSFFSHLYWKMRTLLHGFFSKVPALETAILITDLDSHSYFHWIADTLPKLQLLAKKENQILHELPVLFPEKILKSYALSSLEIFLEEKRIQLIPLWRKIKVKTLYLIPNIAQPEGTGNYRPELMLDIRRKTLEALAHKKETLRLQKKLSAFITLKKEAPLRIYFSRKDAKYRYLKNEMQLMQVLKKYEFTVFEAGKLGFWQQVLLSNWAETMMGLHGAALTNMMWMKSGSNIIELRRENDSHNNCYFSLASALNLNYYYLLAPGDSEDTHKCNFTVDVEKADQLLQEIFLARSHEH